MAYPFVLNAALQARDWVRGRSYTRHRRHLEQSQWWSEEELLRAQWAGLERLLDVAFQSVPYYRKRYAEAGASRGDIRGLDDFRRLPALTREDLRDHLAELNPEGALPRGTHTHATGGSSGVPVRFRRTLESYDWRFACAIRAFEWCGMRPGRRSLHLWGAPVGAPSLRQRAKEGLDHILRGDRFVSTFLQTDEVWARIYRECQSFRPDVIRGYVSSLVQFGRYLSARGLQLPHRLTSLIAAAEPLEANTRAYVESIFQAPLYNTYGSREFMSIAAECERREGLHIHAENLLVEASPDPAAPAPILVTDLHNYGTVFLRYEIGDLGAVSGKRCGCGRGLPMLDSVQGRVLAPFQLAGGRVVSWNFFRHILKDVPEILQYQLRQDSPDKITLLVVLAAPLSAGSQALIRSEFGKVLGPTQYALEPVREIPRSKSGKSKMVEASAPNQ